MAIHFNETNQWYSVTDHVDLTLPDGDWCVGIWIKLDDLDGSGYQYFVSNGNYAATPSFNIFINESTDKVQLNAKDAEGDTANLTPATATVDTDWTLVIVQRRTADSEVQLWICKEDGSATKIASVSDASFDVVNTSSEWNIGRRVDAATDRYFGGSAAEFFKFDGSLTQTEIETLAAGTRIDSMGKTLDMYHPMTSADATLTDEANSNDATRHGSPTTTAHPNPSSDFLPRVAIF